MKICLDLNSSVEQMEQLNLVAGGELTISSGAITITKSLHTVDTEGDAVTDDLNTINGGSAGDVILLGRASTARAVVLKHNAGNIKTPAGTDHELTANGFVLLKHDGSNWHVQSGNGSGYALNKLACLTVATSNITLSGEQTINGVSCTENDRVFLAGQTDPKENGPWLVKAAGYYDYGTWIRPDDFQNGFSVSGHLFYIEQGTEYSDSVWMITSGYGEDIVGTDDLNAINLGGGTGGSFDIVSLTEDDTNTSSDYFPKYDGANKKIKLIDLKNPGISTLTDGATITLNLSEPERFFSVTLGGNRQLAILNAKPGMEFWLDLIQDGTGSRTVSWWSTINWPGGSAPTLTTTAGKRDCFLFKCTATNTFVCLHQQQNVDTNTGGSVDVTSDLVSYWKLDETSGTRYDSVGSHDLDDVSTSGQNLAGYGSGKLSNCAFFDISNDESLATAVTSGDAFDFQDSDFSFAFWLKVPVVTQNQYIFNHNSKVYCYMQDDGTLQFTCHNESGLTSFRTSGAISDDTWAFVTFVYDSVNDLMKVSFNAGAFETQSHSDGIRALSSGTGPKFNLWNPGLLNGFTDGNIDEFGVWSKALSLAEVSYLYNSGSGRTIPFV